MYYVNFTATWVNALSHSAEHKIYCERESENQFEADINYKDRLIISTWQYLILRGNKQRYTLLNY